MTTKGSSRKQIIIPMSQGNIDIITKNAVKHIFNINRLFKTVKSSTADMPELKIPFEKVLERLFTRILPKK